MHDALTYAYTQVKRSTRDFEHLSNSLRSAIPSLASLSFEGLDEELLVGLRSYVQELLLLLGDELWSCVPLLDFLDDNYGKSNLMVLQTRHVFERVNLTYSCLNIYLGFFIDRVKLCAGPRLGTTTGP